MFETGNIALRRKKIIHKKKYKQNQNFLNFEKMILH